jgi:hypothetical protein
MTHEYNKQHPTGIIKETLYTMCVFSLEVKSNVFLVKAAKAYEVVEAYMHKFLRDCSKLQHYRYVSKYLGTSDLLTQSKWLVYTT